ncbi:hypothetical protein LguiA_020736 [Lonicera macranthoides]
MNQLSNGFSLLKLDAEDANEQVALIAADNRKSASGGDSYGRVQVTSCVDDLEMTGLNLEVDRILEIACVITDGNLTKVIEGPDLVIHQVKECLEKMGKWCKTHHGESGLTKKVLKSTSSEQEAEKQVADFVKRNVSQKYSPLLAGNSVYMDLLFMQKYMPHLASLITPLHLILGILLILNGIAFPLDDRKAPKKEKKHKAMDDIKESIQELRYYKEHIFKAKSKK